MCNSVATMYVDTSKTKRGSKIYTRNLLRIKWTPESRQKSTEFKLDIQLQQYPAKLTITHTCLLCLGLQKELRLILGFSDTHITLHRLTS